MPTITTLPLWTCTSTKQEKTFLAVMMITMRRISQRAEPITRTSKGNRMEDIESTTIMPTQRLTRNCVWVKFRHARINKWSNRKRIKIRCREPLLSKCLIPGLWSFWKNSSPMEHSLKSTGVSPPGRRPMSTTPSRRVRKEKSNLLSKYTKLLS